MTVYFIGAGIAGVEYLTVKAQQIITQAEVIIYDALADATILEIAPTDCLKINVGKRGGKVSTPQTEINRLLVEYGHNYQKVIRLKSGDAGMFGRINEELACLQTEKIKYELIPGISSALAVPFLAGIMLTEKEKSRSVTILTGHNPQLFDWSALSKLDTLVILMGGRNLDLIVTKLQQYGRPPNFPIAIVKNGGRIDQQIWKGRLDNIVEKTANISLSPCIIIIGEVVAHQY